MSAVMTGVSDDSSLSELSECISFDNKKNDNLNASSSEHSPPLNVSAGRKKQAQQSDVKFESRSRRKNRLAPPPPENHKTRSRSLSRDKGKRVLKQGSTDSDSQVSPYLDLPSTKPKSRSPSPFLARSDKTRFQVLKDVFQSPRNLRRNSKRITKEKGSPGPLKPKPIRKLAVVQVADNKTYGIFCQPLNIDNEFEVKRITEYDRYLQSILDDTDPTHPDYKDLNAALERVKLKTNSLTNNRQESSAILFKHLTVGSKFRTGSNWPQTMGWGPDTGTAGLTSTQQDRLYIMEGPVQLTAGPNTQERYLFLLSDFLLVAKEKSSSTYKLKYKIKISELWLAASVKTASDNTIQADKSIVIGWTALSNNMVVTFADTETQQLWLSKLTERCNAEKARQQLQTLTRPVQESDDSEDETYYDDAANKRKKRSPLRSIFTRRSREETNVNESRRTKSGNLFGKPLESVCTTDNEPPKHILSMLGILFREGPHTAGILRKSANARLCREIKKQVDENEEIILESHQVLAIGSVLKDYLRSLPQSLLLDELYEDWMQIERLDSQEEQIARIKELIKTHLPVCHATLLKYVMIVMYIISTHSDENKMTAYNIAVCIAPSLLKFPNSTNNNNGSSNGNNIGSSVPVSVVQCLIEGVLDVFDDCSLQLFGGIKQIAESDSDSSMLDTGRRLLDGSSIDSLVDMVDSGDGQIDDEEGTGELKRMYQRSASYNDRNTSSTDSGLYSRSLESTSSVETHEPVAPPRKKKDFPYTETFDAFYHYPKPQIPMYRHAIRSHPDLGKRHSGDSLKSVEETREDSVSDVPLDVSNNFRDSDPALSLRENSARQSSIMDTPPLSPHSYFTSSRDSFTSESSRSYDSASLQSNQYVGDDLSETSYSDSTLSRGESFPSSVPVDSCVKVKPRHQVEIIKETQTTVTCSTDITLPISIKHPSNNNTPLSPPCISVTKCYPNSGQKLIEENDDDEDDDDFGFKKRAVEQVDQLAKLDKNSGLPKPTIVPNRTMISGDNTAVCVNIQRSNSFDSIGVHSCSTEYKLHDFSKNDPRRRVTIITRSRPPSQFISNFVEELPSRSTGDLSKLQSVNTLERTRPSQPPSYQEAISRRVVKIPHEISEQDLVKQKTDSARAMLMYQQSLQTYKEEAAGHNVVSEINKTSDKSNYSLKEDNDIYVTLSRDPKRVYQESIHLYEKSTQNIEPIQRTDSVKPPPYSIAMSSKQQSTVQDYTQPEATQTPVIVNKKLKSQSFSEHNAPRRVENKVKNDLPWSVRDMREMFDNKGNVDKSPRLCPPPYNPPPPFKRNNNRLSLSSTSSSANSFGRSGPQNIDFSFSSSEDLSSGSFSNIHEDCSDNFDYTDVSYV
ncbi:uncharacterized protein LOC126811150 isoform X2 [Patella vulgata]|uniref:uncharacterized protein LOC126811150 isoform X2 n=1 Tax=Patella vulgata TaxID=6465 RepID=UPI0024A829CA|nr:uncharacterized protein LOC126811150 isoform X2 [Patella vulgata]